MSDVTVTITGGISGISVTRVSITYTINAIPYCEVTLNAADPATQNVINNQDTYITRLNPTTITVSITPSGSLVTDATATSITFVGFFDGISFSMSMGNLDYKAVFKGVYQLLLEATIVLPGITAIGYNPFKLDLSQLAKSTPNDAIQSFFESTGFPIDVSGYSMNESYYNALQYFANSQATPFTNKLGVAQNDPILMQDGYNALIASGDRTTKMKELITLVSAIDISNVKTLANLNITLSQTTGRVILKQLLEGPANMWENLVNFYTTQGCVIVTSNSKCQILPNNGFITFTVPNYSPQASGIDQGINIGLPADYNSISYQNNGYVDVGYAVVVNDTGNPASSLPNAYSYYGIYPQDGQPSFSPGGGILYLPGSIFQYASADPSTDPATHAPAVTGNQSGKASNVTGIKQPTATTVVASTTAQTAAMNLQQSTGSYVADAANEYAEIKVYQARYGDRTGSINCSFQNNWCPGTVGAIYLKQQSGSNSSTGTYLNVFVTRVTHDIVVNAPRSGGATTNVSFNCGRIGQNTVSVDSDLLYGYSMNDVLDAQNTFIDDIS